ncbi:MAG: hypothetical protein IKL73_06655 [Lachnospiraceae bacterium]|nr:hypothetical protein [Lachnospiraceae bacterium]
MNRMEFVDTLRATLALELPNDKVEENVRYYNDYILSMGDENRQKEEIERIGDPHLIAQTIIDAYKMSEPYKYEEQKMYGYSQESNEAEEFSKEEESNVWAKVKRIAITSGIVLIAFALLYVAFGLFIRIGLPLIGIYIIIRLIKRSME